MFSGTRENLMMDAVGEDAQTAQQIRNKSAMSSALLSSL